MDCFCSTGWMVIQDVFLPYWPPMHSLNWFLLPDCLSRNVMLFLCVLPSGLCNVRNPISQDWERNISILYNSSGHTWITGHVSQIGYTNQWNRRNLEQRGGTWTWQENSPDLILRVWALQKFSSSSCLFLSSKLPFWVTGRGRNGEGRVHP